MVTVTIDGSIHEARGDERLIDLINRTGTELAQVFYHPQLGPIQTCDTCMVEVDGKLIRACAASRSPLGGGRRVMIASRTSGWLPERLQAIERLKIAAYLLECAPERARGPRDDRSRPAHAGRFRSPRARPDGA